MLNLVRTQTMLTDRLRLAGYLVFQGLEAKTVEDKHWFLQRIAQELGLDLPPSLEVPVPPPTTGVLDLAPILNTPF